MRLSTRQDKHDGVFRLFVYRGDSPLHDVSLIDMTGETDRDKADRLLRNVWRSLSQVPDQAVYYVYADRVTLQWAL